MNKWIAICIMAALVALVVTAAYAPTSGTADEEPDTVALDQQKAIAALEAKLDTVLANQTLILEKIEAIQAEQEKLQKDIAYIRGKTH
jgi:peptidoglycan hydrolase CwlO-like protein